MGIAASCEKVNNCQFLKKYRFTKSLACKGFISMYCEGPKGNDCKRKEYVQQYKQAPHEDMMPNGKMIVMR